MLASLFMLLAAHLASARRPWATVGAAVLQILVGPVAFAAVGFGLMYPSLEGPLLAPEDDPLGMPPEQLWQDVFTQAGMATVVTLIAGGPIVARGGWLSRVLVAVTVAGLVYPVIGSWVWGGGWLDSRGFYDFGGAALIFVAGGCFAVGSLISRERSSEAETERPARVGTPLLLLALGCAALAPLAQVDIGATVLVGVAAGFAGYVLTAALFKIRPDAVVLACGMLAGQAAAHAAPDRLGLVSQGMLGLAAGVAAFGATRAAHLRWPEQVVPAACGAAGALTIVGAGALAEQLTLRAQVLGVAAIAVTAGGLGLGFGAALRRLGL